MKPVIGLHNGLTFKKRVLESKLDYYLTKYFNSTTFRLNQKEIIETILAGNDAFVRFPTGMGKSLCYQLPALIMEGIVVVISPLIALMKDQVDSLNKKGIHSAYLNSTIPPKKYKQIKEDCLANKFKILYISPEGLLKEFESFISQIPVSVFAIDEAHTIMQWGFDFRPEYSELAILKNKFPKVPIIAVTASVTNESQNQILSILRIEKAKVFSAALYRNNIALSVRRNASGGEKLNEISKLCKKYSEGCGIVFCNTRRTAASIANKLKFRGIEALSYHAGMTRTERDFVQQSFINGEAKVICATIAFGMGIDKRDIRWIVHYNIPQNIETYYQEIGRAGRDGKNCEAILFYNNEDTSLIETFAQRSGNIDANMDKLERVNLYARVKTCRWKYILDYFGEQEDIHNCHCDNCISNLKSD